MDVTGTSAIEEAEVLILGAGLAGLSAAASLGEHAIVLERSDRPGGLVRSECFDNYWFDRVIHLLYFADPRTEGRIKNLMGSDLKPCPPVAWVECAAGIARFPLQLHLGTLESKAVAECLVDFIEARFAPQAAEAQNFEELLLHVFGRAMCEIFFFPYNRKMWKRPLNSLRSSGFQWNIARPDLIQVLKGALNPRAVTSSYNSAGWYPRPSRGSPVRGMEILSRRLASQVADLRLRHSVEAIDLDARLIAVSGPSGQKNFRFNHCCVATLPLPEIVAKCRQAPEDLREACARLQCNRVLSAALSIRGPRPVCRGHWRYYTDESVSFTRLIYPHEFDPDCAPPEGWCLLAEITEPAEWPLVPEGEVLARVKADLLRVGALPPDCNVIDAHVFVVDPAYVVFSHEEAAIAEQARPFLISHGIIPLGRYGRWEYSSMAQVMRDGFQVADAIRAELPSQPPYPPHKPAVSSDSARRSSSNA
jgi:protoporphyrinogen oxidase